LHAYFRESEGMQQQLAASVSSLTTQLLELASKMRCLTDRQACNTLHTESTQLVSLILLTSRFLARYDARLNPSREGTKRCFVNYLVKGTLLLNHFTTQPASRAGAKRCSNWLNQ